MTPEREAVVSLRVRGPEAVEQEIEAVIDTGFNGFLALPPDLVARLGLTFAGPTRATLGDGSNVHLSLFEAIVVWDGKDRNVGVLETEGGPLIGMSLLHGFDLRIRVVERGAVTIVAVE